MLQSKIEALIDESKYDKACELVAKKFKIKLEILHSEIGTMDWDKKNLRRIFDLRLSTPLGSYDFKFGQSINDSCINVMKKQTEVCDEIEVFAGLKTKSGYASTKFKLYKKDDFEISNDRFEEIRSGLETDYLKSVSSSNKKWIEKFEAGSISKDLMKKKLENPLNSGASHQCIQNAILRELNKTIDTNEPSDKVVNPTMYDVLTCLQKYDVGTFDDFCSNFGYDTDSRSAERTYNAVCEEFNAISEIFTPEQLEVLDYIQ